MATRPPLPPRQDRGWRPSKSTLWLLVAFCILFPILFCTLRIPGKAKDTYTIEFDAEKGAIIGIDLGTTYSCVAAPGSRNGEVEIIVNSHGESTTPSYVAFTSSGERLVGLDAKNQAASNPLNTVFDIKRVLGRPFSDPVVQVDLQHFPFALENKAGKPVVRIATELFTPEEILAQVLMDLKRNAEGFLLGKKVTHAVVTVPAHFNDAQREATKDAVRLAGMEVIRIINEHTAAAIAYGSDKRVDESLVVVYDLGGGTFDVSLLDIEGGVFEVLATGGDNHLGGDDFDNRVITHFADLWNSHHPGDNVQSDPEAMSRLKREVEKAKRALSTDQSAHIDIQSFHGGADLSETLTREKFEDLNQDLFQKTLATLDAVLKGAKIKHHKIAEVILVGGSTRIPMVRKLVGEYFKGKVLDSNINPDEAVAYGAAIIAAILSSPDEGCSVPSLDITPLGLGIETHGGIMTTIVMRSSVIPTRKTQVFSTTQDNQESVKINVYEGARPMVSDNNLLGSFELTDIPPARCGVPQIEVTFEIDPNGIISVNAVDKETGKIESIKIINTNRNSYEEIDRMIIESEEYYEKDLELKKTAEARIKFLLPALKLGSLTWIQSQARSGRDFVAELEDKLSRGPFSKEGEEFEVLAWLGEYGRQESEALDYEARGGELTKFVSAITS